MSAPPACLLSTCVSFITKVWLIQYISEPNKSNSSSLVLPERRLNPPRPLFFCFLYPVNEGVRYIDTNVFFFSFLENLPTFLKPGLAPTVMYDKGHEAQILDSIISPHWCHRAQWSQRSLYWKNLWNVCSSIHMCVSLFTSSTPRHAALLCLRCLKYSPRASQWESSL